MNYYTVTSFWSAKPLLHYSTSNHIAKKKNQKKEELFFLTINKENNHWEYSKYCQVYKERN